MSYIMSRLGHNSGSLPSLLLDYHEAESNIIPLHDAGFIHRHTVTWIRTFTSIHHLCTFTLAPLSNGKADNVKKHPHKGFP